MHIPERRRESRSTAAAAEDQEEQRHMGSKSATFPYSPPASGKRQRPCLMPLLLALATALLCAFVFHTFRERRLLALMLEDHDLELHSLHALLQKEKAVAGEMRRKVEELREEAVSLRSQRSGLTQQLAEARNVAGYLRERQRELESTQEESDAKIKMLAALESDFAKAKNQIKLLKKQLERQGDRFTALKHRMEELSSGKQSNATADHGGELHVNQTDLPIDVVDGKSRDDEPQAGEAVLLEEEKPVRNETGEAKGSEAVLEEERKPMMNETGEAKGEEQLLTANADGEGGSEADVLKQVAGFDGNGTILESGEQTAKQTDAEGGVLAAEELLSPSWNKSSGQEEQGSSKPEVPADSTLVEQLQVTDSRGSDQESYSLKLAKDHVNPAKQKRRRHRSRSARGDGQHSTSGKSLDGNGEGSGVQEDEKSNDRLADQEKVSLSDGRDTSDPSAISGSATDGSGGQESSLLKDIAIKAASE